MDSSPRGQEGPLPAPQTADEAPVANQANQRLGIADASTDDPAYQPAYRDQPEHDA